MQKLFTTLTLAFFLMFFYFSSSVIYYPNLVHATEGDHTTRKKLPPPLHGPSFPQQPHASVIGNCFQEAGADRLGHTHGKAVSTEEADYCNGFFLCKLLEFKRPGRNWWFGYFETVLKTNSLSWDVPVALRGCTDLPS